jgi:hypothetical protein
MDEELKQIESKIDNLIFNIEKCEVILFQLEIKEKYLKSKKICLKNKCSWCMR